MEKDPTVPLPMSGDSPIPSPLAATGCGNPFLDQEAAQSGVHKTVLYLRSGGTQDAIGNTFISRPVMKTEILQDPDRHNSYHSVI